MKHQMIGYKSPWVAHILYQQISAYLLYILNHMCVRLGKHVYLHKHSHTHMQSFSLQIHYELHKPHSIKKSF